MVFSLNHIFLFSPYPTPLAFFSYSLLLIFCNIPTMGIALSNLGITLEVQANVYIFTGQN